MLHLHGSLTQTQIDALLPTHEIAQCGVPEAWRMLINLGEEDPHEMVMWTQGVLMMHTLPPIDRLSTR